MRIAHLIHGLGLGGAQQVIKFIVQGRSADFEHWVYSCHGGVFQQPIKEAGGTVRILPRRLPKLDPWWIIAMARAMKQDRIDVAHGHLFGDTLHGYFAARRAGLPPLVMTLHNSTDARSRLQLAGYRRLIGARTVPVACAEFVRQSFIETLGDPGRRIRTIANGIDFDPPHAQPDRRALNALGIDPEAVVFATLGRMERQKAYHLLLEAFARLDVADHPPFQLLMFGDGSLRHQLEAQARTLNLGDRVVFAGFRNDVPQLLPLVDVVVFSSIFEGLPIALLEAMASAKALVVTEVGGMPDALDQEVEALRVPPSNVEALADALGRIAKDPALRRRLGEAAQQRFEREFTAEHMVRSYETLYRDVAAGGEAT